MKDYDDVLSATKEEADAEDKEVDDVDAPVSASDPDPAPKSEGNSGKEQSPHVILGKEAEMQDLVTQKLKKMQEKESRMGCKMEREGTLPGEESNHRDCESQPLVRFRCGHS